ncbi:penicillin acylase family protein [Flagellimonas sp. DF-77]|uniref:penicillin acylase family protein n=1 Tax=Flagellimonas algarum TaxID=3230298 RepID=UPI0033996B4F
MKRLKKILLALLGLFAILALFIFIFLNSLTPTYEGKQELKGLDQGVEVYFDAYGVPHIYADNETDAIRTLGYVHAQDRLWQMELLRRAGSGGLSEIFGDLTLETDKFFLSLGIDDYNQKALAKLDRSAASVQLAEAYLDGINQFIDNGPTPVEFYLTGLEKQKFDLKDVYNAVSYMGFTFNKGARDIVNTNLLHRLDSVYTHPLFQSEVPGSLKIPVYPDSTANGLMALHEQMDNALSRLPIPEIYGSNSWVLAPEKTATGKVLFENDPHIAQAQPSVWYEAHLVTPDYEKYGYYLAGVPFPLLSHDRFMAHGFTMLANDDTNFYYEEAHPEDSTRYRFKGEWRNFDFVTKTIKVKDAPDVEFVYRKTHRGPIVNDNFANRTRVEGDRLVSMHWLFTQFENRLVEGLYGINHAESIEEFATALPNIHAPGLNVMYGDADGNIAWWGTAKLYRMPDSTSTKFILDGTTGDDDPTAYLGFEHNPHAINPPWHYVYSANNQPDSISGMYVPGYFANSVFRAGRIIDRMEEKPTGWTKNDMMDMANDITLRTGAEFLKRSFSQLDVSGLSDRQVGFLDLADKWDGRFDGKSVPAVFYEKFRQNLHRDIFADEFDSIAEYASYGVQLKMRMIFDDEASKWWDDLATDDIVETKAMIITKAFHDAWAQLTDELGTDYTTWTWDRVHFLEHDHPIGRVASLRKYFNVGPMPTSGTGGTLNNQGFRRQADGTFKVTSIPSTRRIIDFSDIEGSMSILPTGQSGNPLSRHYRDQAEMYANGEYRGMLMNEEEIKARAIGQLDFEPTN